MEWCFIDITIIIIILFLAFCCEFLDSSLGMGYGTLMCPILLLLGFDVFLVIPSILFSEMLTSLSATIFHHEMGNCNLGLKEKNIRVVFLFTILCVITMIISIIIVLQIPKVFIEIYIGISIIFVGFVLLFIKSFKFSWKKLEIFSIISAFNKAISGGGFGPILTTGQIISGRDAKQAIGVTKAAKFLISIAGFFTFYIIYGISDYTLLKLLVISGTFAAFFGAFGTSKIKNQSKARFLIGSIAIMLGIIILVKFMVWRV
ncbi:MAG: sulfite exporter TauE/SafE family protein [Candidatus Hodarchaeota archaeon]